MLGLEFLFLRLLFFFFNDPATPEIYTLSLHDALPICRPRSPRRGRSRRRSGPRRSPGPPARATGAIDEGRFAEDRKSTRLNSSHVEISYAVFCLKKKKIKKK